MNKFSFPLFFLVLSTASLFAQTEVTKLLSGKIMVDSLAIEKVNVLNDTSGKATISNQKGEFTIVVKVGDAIVFTAVNLETKRRIISEGDLKMTQLIIKMSTSMNPLKEVKVNDNSVSAEKLGIIPYGQKKYTSAERKLYTARSGLLDPLLNKMSGRTTMLKKEVQVERKERLLLQLDGWYEDHYYTDVLKIPNDYIKGFQYFLIDDADFVRALQAKNKTLTLFLVKRLALDYLDLLKEEAH